LGLPLAMHTAQSSAARASQHSCAVAKIRMVMEWPFEVRVVSVCACW